MQQVEAALASVHRPDTPQQVRLQAQQVLDAFKLSNESAQWAFAVLQQPSTAPQIRHFALQCLSSFLLTRWQGWDQPTQDSFRQAVMNLMGGKLEDEPFMRERVALLISDIAERVYPGHWEQMIPELMAIWESGAKPAAQIVLAALRNIAEDCFDGDFNSRLPTSRRTEILKSLNVQLPSVLPRLYMFMSHHYANCHTDANSMDLLKCTLKLLERLISWMSLGLFVSDDCNLLAVFILLVKEPDLRTEAVECIRNMALRKFENVDLIKVYLRHTEEWLNQTFTTPDYWKSLGFCQAISYLLEGFITINLPKIVEDPSFFVPDSYDAKLLQGLLTIVGQLIALPSFKASYHILHGCAVIFREKKIAIVPGAKEVLRQAFVVYSERVVKIPFEEGSFVDNPLADEEFLDYDDFLQHLGNMRTQFSALTGSAPQIYPETALEFVLMKVPELLDRDSRPTDKLDEKGRVTNLTTGYITLESFASPLERIMSSLAEVYKDGVGHQDALNKIGMVVTRLLAWQTQDPLLLYTQFMLLEGFKKFYRFLGPILWNVVDRLFDNTIYKDPLQVVDLTGSKSARTRQYSQEAIQVRRKAMNVLVEVCQTSPDVMVPWLEPLSARVKVLIDSGEIFDSQRPQLVEMLLVVSEALPDPQRRQASLANLLSDYVNFWTSPDVSLAFSSVDKFLECLGVTPISVAPDQQTFDRVAEWIHQILAASNTFLGVARRMKLPFPECYASYTDNDMALSRALLLEVPTMDFLLSLNPLTPLWASILPNIFQMLHVIHSLWNPTTKAQLCGHPYARHLIRMHDEEVKAKTRSGSQLTPTTWGSDESNQALVLQRYWPMWLNQMRQTAYQLLEKACEQKVLYLEPRALEGMQTLVTQHIPHMEHRHVAWFLKIVIDVYVTNCPVPLFASCLPPILSPVMSHMCLRGSVTWNGSAPTILGNLAQGLDFQVLRDGGLVVIQEGLNTEAMDMLLDKTKREMTRSYLEMLESILGMRGATRVVVADKDKLGGPEGEMEKVVLPSQEYSDALAKFIVIDRDDLSVPLLLSFIGALCWQDTQACRRAIKLSHKAIEVGSREPKLYPAFGQELFQQVIGALLREDKWVAGLQWDLVSLASEIYRLLILGENIKEPVVARLPGPIYEAPRAILLTIPGITPEHVTAMEAKMLGTHAPKEQRDYFRELLRTASDEMARQDPSQQSDKNESILRSKVFNISSLPTRIMEKGYMLSQLASGKTSLDDADGDTGLHALFGS